MVFIKVDLGYEQDHAACKACYIIFYIRKMNRKKAYTIEVSAALLILLS
jgi:hypothetical protein